MAAGTTTYGAGAAAAEVGPVLQADGFELAAPRRVTIAVLDTFDGRLAAAGLRLTATAPSDTNEPVTLKLSGDDGADAEVTVAGMPRIAADVPAGPLRARLARLLDVRVLLPLLTVAATRVDAVKRNPSGKITAMVAVTGTVRLDGGKALDGTFVEVDELIGYSSPAAGARDVLEAAGCERLDFDLLGHAAAVSAVDLTGTAVNPGIPLDAAAATIDGFRAVLANLRDAVVVNYDGTVADLDPEFLHDLRVAVRRTRAMLSNAKKVIPAEVLQPTRDDFKWFGQITGPARDLDVYQIEWPTYVGQLDAEAIAALDPVREHLAGRCVTEHETLSRELQGERAGRVLADWAAWLDQPIERSGLPPRALDALGPFVADRIGRAHRKMIDRGRDITPTTAAEELHELRKDAKKLRYLIECFGGLYEPAARKAFVQRLKALQDNLGEHQDAEVHVAQLGEVITQLAGQSAVETVLATGRLIERMEQRRLASRDEFAERFAGFDSDPTRTALAALLASSSPAAAESPR